MMEIIWGFEPDKELIEQSDEFMVVGYSPNTSAKWKWVLESYNNHYIEREIFGNIGTLPFKKTAGKLWFDYDNKYINYKNEIIADDTTNYQLVGTATVKYILSQYKGPFFSESRDNILKNTIGKIDGDKLIINKDIPSPKYLNIALLLQTYSNYILNRNILTLPKLNQQIILYRHEYGWVKEESVSKGYLEYLHKEYTKLNNIIPVAHFKSYSYRYDLNKVSSFFMTKIILPPNFPFYSYADPSTCKTSEACECLLPYTLDPTGKTLNYGLKILEVDNNFKNKGGHMITVKPVLLDDPIKFRNFHIDKLVIKKKTVYGGFFGVFQGMQTFNKQTFDKFKSSTDPEHQQALKLYYMWKKLMDIKENEIVTNNDSLQHITTNLIKLLENL
jgi:hypothetical protein